MKKLLVSAIMMVSLMGGSAFAATGTVGTIYLNATTGMLVSFVRDDSSLTGAFHVLGSAEHIKTVTAVILTAKANGARLQFGNGTVDGILGWTNVNYIIQQ